jgi:hypothetical protein
MMCGALTLAMGRTLIRPQDLDTFSRLRLMAGLFQQSADVTESSGPRHHRFRRMLTLCFIPRADAQAALTVAKEVDLVGD